MRWRELLVEGVGSGQDKSHEMRRNGENLLWDMKMARSQEKLDFLKIQWKNYFY